MTKLRMAIAAIRNSALDFQSASDAVTVEVATTMSGYFPKPCTETS